ncbi:MAG: GAF domain-containing protein [Dehalococcoidia bacterium]
MKKKSTENSDIKRPVFGIRAKILVSFLAVSLVSVGVISVFAFRNMTVVGNTAMQNTISLGQSAVQEGIAALEDSGRRIIKLRADVVANDVADFIEDHPDLTINELADNKELRAIAVQTVGQTGATMVYGQDGTIYFNIDPDLVGTNVARMVDGSPDFLSIIESSLSGEAAGYYKVTDDQGEERSKYMYVVSVKDTSLLLAASTYIDEFSRPAEATESRIMESVSSITSYINGQMKLAQWTFIVVILCMAVIIAVIASFMARTITEPILALTKGAEVISRGELDHIIKVNTGDEIELLANQFNTMTSAVKESRSDLEKKVRDRTKRERQRAEQLRTINEISRKISSIMNLDELLPYVANLLRETLDYHNVNIFLFEQSSEQLILKEICLSGYKGVIPLEVPLEMGDEGVVAWVAHTGEPLLVNDVSKEPKYWFIEELSAIKSELAVPIRIGDRNLGVLDIESNELDAFNEADLYTAQTLADQLAIAIENARLYQATGQIAVMEERNRMAREIHDTLAQGFTGIILQLEAAEQALESNVSEVEKHLNKARSLARGSLNEARRSVWNLRSAALEQLSLSEALRQEVFVFAQNNNIKARFDISEEARELPPDIDTAVLRICQEALTNIRKHANATEVKVDLTFDDAEVTLSIRDNGVGLQSEEPKEGETPHRGFGLISMQERARNVGGKLELQSEEGKGTFIKVTIPVI